MPESRSRNAWIIVVVIVVVLCCFALAAALAVAAFFAIRPIGSLSGVGTDTLAVEQAFEVGEAPSLAIDNFAGSILVRAGPSGEARVVARKRAPLGSDLERIQVEILERDGGLVIRTTKAPNLTSASVQLEVTTPRGTFLDADTGAGSVEVHGLDGGVRVHTGAGSVSLSNLQGTVSADTGAGSLKLQDIRGQLEARSGSGSVDMDRVTGEVDAHTGSGSIRLNGAEGPVQLDTGSGSVDFDGRPDGSCRFETGTGTITLRLPVELSMQLDLHTGLGSIELEFTVDGEVTRSEVKGVVGDGSQGSIYAHTGAGSIHLVRR